MTLSYGGNLLASG